MNSHLSLLSACDDVSERSLIVPLVLIKLAVARAQRWLTLFVAGGLVSANAQTRDALFLDHDFQRLDVARLVDVLLLLLGIARLLGEPPFVLLVGCGDGLLGFLCGCLSRGLLGESEVSALAEALKHGELVELRDSVFSELVLGCDA